MSAHGEDRTSFELGPVLASGARLLQQLARAPEFVSAARRLTTEWAKDHPDVEVELLVDRPPASRWVDYDLLLTLQSGETICLTWCSDNLTPWVVSYGDHWAANFLVTINGQSISIQHALRELALITSQSPSSMEDLVRHVLEAQEAGSRGENIASSDIHLEIDEFRKSRGLKTAKETEEWLTRHALTLADLADLAVGEILQRRMKYGRTQAELAEYFSRHQSDYDRITFTVAVVETSRQAQTLLAESSQKGLLRAITQAIEVQPSMLQHSVTSTQFAMDIDPQFAGTKSGELLGPIRQHGMWGVAQLHRRDMATLDVRTTEAVIDALYETWLSGRRDAASVVWHWL